MRERDSQRAKFGRVFSATPNTGNGWTNEECEKFFHRVVRSHWYKKQWGSQIHVPPHQWLPNQKRVLYRMAWIVARRKYGVHISRHGRDFCRVYLEMVKRFMGPEAAATLKEEYKKNGIKHYKKKELTEEQKEVLRERMFVARQALMAKNVDALEENYEV